MSDNYAWRDAAPSRLGFLADELEELVSNNLYMPVRLLGSPQGPRCVIDGREVINLASNNYLGLAAHPRLIEAAIEGLQQFGAGTGAARMICGNTPLHVELEQLLADFKGTEAALAFQTGYATNLGLIPALIGRGDAVVSDELNHASIIDGCRMSGATIKRYRHADPEDAGAQLRAARVEGASRVLLVTDGVFSMDGDIAPLPALVEQAQRYDALMMVDDAHGVGVLGEGGRGTVAHFGLESQVEIQVGTLSKALGGMGGYVAASHALVAWLMRRHRPFVFSASTHSPADVAAAIAGIRLLREEPERLSRLWDNAAYFRQGLIDRGFNTGKSETPIIPVIVGESGLSARLSELLFEEGIFATAITYPIVARDQARLRTIVTSEHTRADLDEALAAFHRLGARLGITR